MNETKNELKQESFPRCKCSVVNYITNVSTQNRELNIIDSKFYHCRLTRIPLSLLMRIFKKITLKNTLFLQYRDYNIKKVFIVTLY